MYDEAWYSLVQEQPRKSTTTSKGHEKRQSLLQQANGPLDVIKPLEQLLEQPETIWPPDAEVLHRVNSCPNLNAYSSSLKKRPKKAVGKRKEDLSWEALEIAGDHDRHANTAGDMADGSVWDKYSAQVAEANIAEYTLYLDQLSITQQHIDSLISGADEALKTLGTLARSFRTVHDQTTSFQSQCSDILTEQRRLQALADAMAADLDHYTYLDTATRRINAPGASRLAEHEELGEIFHKVDRCTNFMHAHPNYRDAESYEARYQSLLTKALHLLETGFSSVLDRISVELGAQIAETSSDSIRHALAYGRFKELLLESHDLIPNVRCVLARVFKPLGGPVDSDNINRAVYVNTTQNMVNAFLTARDRDLKPLMQQQVDNFKADTKDATAGNTAIEASVRKFLSESFERAWNEFGLFKDTFGVEPHFNNDPASAFSLLRQHQRQLVNIGNLAPVAQNIQPVLRSAGLRGICVVVGWLKDEYLMHEPHDEMSEWDVLCQELSIRLLSEHLWTLADATFEAEIATLAKSPMVADALKPQAKPYPPVEQALELLTLFDDTMPKERSQKSSPVVFHLVQGVIQTVQKAEGRLRSQANAAETGFTHAADPDLFVVKNLLVVKHALTALELGDVRDVHTSQSSLMAGALPALQHLGPLWDTITPATSNLIGWVGSFMPWSRTVSGSAPSASASGVIGGGVSMQDAGAVLEDLLRKSIVAFTRRWAQQLVDARTRMNNFEVSNTTASTAVKANAGADWSLREVERELESLLAAVFPDHPDVVVKLKEAIDEHTMALVSGKGLKGKGSATTRS